MFSNSWDSWVCLDVELTTQMKSKAAATCLVCESVEIKAEWCRLRLSFASFFNAQQCHNWVLSVSVCVLQYLLLASLWCFLLPITRQFGFATLQCNPLHHLGRDNVFAFWSFLSQMPAPGRGRWILQQASTDPAGRSVWASLSTEDCKGSIKCVMQCMQQNNRVKMMKGVQKPQSDERYTFFSANVIHKCRIFLCHVHCQRVNNTDAQIPFSFVGAS